MRLSGNARVVEGLAQAAARASSSGVDVSVRSTRTGPSGDATTLPARRRGELRSRHRGRRHRASNTGAWLTDAEVKALPSAPTNAVPASDVPVENQDTNADIDLLD